MRQGGVSTARLRTALPRVVAEVEALVAEARAAESAERNGEPAL